MQSLDKRHDDGERIRSEGQAPEPAEGGPVTERIVVSGLDQQSAEALRIAVTRLARRYGIEVRTEVGEELPGPPE